jgi:hypothetical protein
MKPNNLRVVLVRLRGYTGICSVRGLLLGEVIVNVAVVKSTLNGPVGVCWPGQVRPVTGLVDTLKGVLPPDSVPNGAEPVVCTVVVRRPLGCWSFDPGLMQPEVTDAFASILATAPVPAPDTAPVHVNTNVVGATVQFGPELNFRPCPTASAGVIEEAESPAAAITIMTMVVDLIERIFFINLYNINKSYIWFWWFWTVFERLSIAMHLGGFSTYVFYKRLFVKNH